MEIATEPPPPNLDPGHFQESSLCSSPNTGIPDLACTRSAVEAGCEVQGPGVQQSPMSPVLGTEDTSVLVREASVGCAENRSRVKSERRSEKGERSPCGSDDFPCLPSNLGQTGLNFLPKVSQMRGCGSPPHHHPGFVSRGGTSLCSSVGSLCTVHPPARHPYPCWNWELTAAILSPAPAWTPFLPAWHSVILLSFQAARFTSTTTIYVPCFVHLLFTYCVNILTPL